MSVLLDTHILAWWFQNSDELSPNARMIIGNRENQIFVSPVSAYEMIWKYRNGKWRSIGELAENFQKYLMSEGFTDLPITVDAMVCAAELDGRHKDPWDRILVAQVMRNPEMALLTADPMIQSFEGLESIRA